MSNAGRPATPLAVLKMRGSKHVAERVGEPVDPVASPECPSWMKAEARAEWFRVVPILQRRQTLSEADYGHLVGMCDWWGQYVTARQQVQELGSQPYQGHLMDHPRVVMNTAWKEYSKAAQQFGMTQVSKARVRVSDEQGKDKTKGRFFSPKLAG